MNRINVIEPMIKNCIDRLPLPETFMTIPCPTLTDKKLGFKKRLRASRHSEVRQIVDRSGSQLSVVSCHSEVRQIAHRSIVYTRFLGSVRNY